MVEVSGAPIGGFVVALASNSALLTVPPSVTVAGSSSANLTATAGYGTKERATITASTASFGKGSASVSLIIGREQDHPMTLPQIGVQGGPRARLPHLRRMLDRQA